MKETFKQAIERKKKETGLEIGKFLEDIKTKRKEFDDYARTKRKELQDYISKFRRKIKGQASKLV